MQQHPKIKKHPMRQHRVSEVPVLPTPGELLTCQTNHGMKGNIIIAFLPLFVNGGIFYGKKT